MPVEAPDPDSHLIARHLPRADRGGEVGPQLARLGVGGMAGEVAELMPAQQDRVAGLRRGRVRRQPRVAAPMAAATSVASAATEADGGGGRGRPGRGRRR